SSITNLSSFVQVNEGWSGTVQPSSGSCSGGGGSGRWKLATHCMKYLANKPKVKFRFTFGSGTTCNDYDGLAFDDFYLGEAPSVTSSIRTTCIDSSTVSFKDVNSGCHGFWD